MGWAEIRIQQYNQGEKANWLERQMLEHANPVHFVLLVLGAISLYYGLWIHNWRFIVVGFLLHYIGHWCCRLIKLKEN